MEVCDLKIKTNKNKKIPGLEWDFSGKNIIDKTVTLVEIIER